MTLGISGIMSRCPGVLLALVLLVACIGTSSAEQLTSGTSSRRARQEAIDSIPFAQINPAAREKLREVLESPSIYRRLPVTQIECDPDYFVFLVRQPEVIVNIWQLMGITKMSVNRTGPFRMATNDGAGATSDVELVYGTAKLHVYYGEGAYVGPILNRKLKGRCVLVLRSEYLAGEENQTLTRSSMDVFLKVDNATASLVAKTLNPIVGSTADHNFVESLHFLERLNETTQKNGRGVQQMAGRLVNLTPEVRNQFVQVAGMVAARAGVSGARRGHRVGRPSIERDASHNGTISPHSQSSGMSSTEYARASLGQGGGARETRVTLSDREMWGARGGKGNSSTSMEQRPYPYPIPAQPVIQRTRYYPQR